MLPNFNQQILEVTNQVNSFIRKKTPIPNKLLDYYNNLLSAESNIKNSSVSSIVNSESKLFRINFSNFTTVQAIDITMKPTFVILQNNGDDDLFFSPDMGIVETLNVSNSFVLSPGVTWSSDQKEFIQLGINITAQNPSTSILVGYYIGLPSTL